MNNDLISREALKKALEEDMKHGGVKTDEFDKGYDLGVETAIEMLDNAPTEPNRFDEGYALGYKDGQNERPHGKWLFKEVTDDHKVYGQCSVCKLRKRIDNYCPHCGTKMDGGEEE